MVDQDDSRASKVASRCTLIYLNPHVRIGVDWIMQPNRPYIKLKPFFYMTFSEILDFTSAFDIWFLFSGCYQDETNAREFV
jgi:hypothetical protein